MNFNDQDFDKTEEELWEQYSAGEGIDRAETSIQLAEALLSKGRYDEALALCEVAVQIYEENPESVVDSDFAIAYERMALSLSALGRMGDGGEFAQKAAKISEDLDPDISAGLYRLASQLWYGALDWDRTIECSTKAAQQLDQHEDLIKIGQDFFNIGISYYNLENWQQAILNLQWSRENFKRAKKPTWVAYCDEELAKCYLKIGDGVLAERHGRQALDYANTVIDNDRQRTSNFLYGQAKKLAGEYVEAEKYLKTAQYMLTVDGEKDWGAIIRTEEAIAEVYQLTDRGQESDEILRRIETVKSSLQDLEQLIDTKHGQAGEYVQLALDLGVA